MHIPDGWSHKDLDQIAIVERDRFSPRPRNDPRYYNGDMPFVQTGDVASAGTFLKSYTQTLNQEGIKVSKVFPKNTILITIAANIGETAITSFVEKLNIQHSQGFQLRFMLKRWGSCTGRGHILLNPELIAAPKDCIDYVITHELCHVKEHNHSPAFYRLLTNVMKDWESRKKRLNEIVEVRFI